MKKLLSIILLSMFCFVLVGCGVPEEKLSQVDSNISKMETLVSEATKEVEKTNNTGYEDVQEYYNQTKVVLDDVKNVFTEIKNEFGKNRDSYTEEQVDEFIKQTDDLVKQSEELKQNAIDEAKHIGDAIVKTEAIQ